MLAATPPAEPPLPTSRTLGRRFTFRDDPLSLEPQDQ